MSSKEEGNHWMNQDGGCILLIMALILVWGALSVTRMIHDSGSDESRVKALEHRIDILEERIRAKE